MSSSFFNQEKVKLKAIGFGLRSTMKKRTNRTYAAVTNDERNLINGRNRQTNNDSAEAPHPKIDTDGRDETTHY